MQKINRILIKNFRQYRNVELSFEDEKGIILFIGRTGSGKSNLLNAICWCLYAKEPFHTSDERTIILNEGVEKESKLEEYSVNLEVQIDDIKYQFNRKGNVNGQSLLNVYEKDGQNWKHNADSNAMVEMFLPEALMRFFMFDGESVQNLFKGDYSEKLRESVWKVSNIELLSNAYKHLKVLKTDINKRIGTTNIEVNVVQEEFERTENNIESKNQELIKMRGQKETALINKEKLIQKSREIEKYQEQTSKRASYQERLSILLENFEKIQASIDDVLVREGIFGFLYKSLGESISAIEEIRNRGELPPRIRNVFISDLIDAKSLCICGRSIGEHEITHLKLLMEKNSPLEDRSFLEDDVLEMKIFKKIAEDLPEKLINLEKEKNSIEEEIKKVQQFINNINEELGDATEGGMNEIQESINGFEKLIEQKAIEIAQLENDIKMLEIDKKNKANELSELIQKDAKNQIEKKKLDFIEKNLKILNQIQENIIEKVRESTSIRAEEYFMELIWKKETFSTVTFDKDYRVSVIKYGQSENCLEKLSTGETKVLGFATIKALTSISGFSDVPVFIDAPLEYLDEHVKREFLNLIPSFLPEKQLFIFSPDGEEITDFASKFVQENNCYRIVYDENELTSSIVRKNGQ